MVSEWEDYLRLFQHVRGETVIGEASVGYLWSETAARNIHAKIPSAKIPLVLRDPADRAFSQYLRTRWPWAASAFRSVSRSRPACGTAPASSACKIRRWSSASITAR
jgi:hypothetical protein